MLAGGKSTRFHERKKFEIPVDAEYSDDGEKTWTESTLTEEATICGAGFILSRPVEPKRLIHLKMPMPKKFRLFDFSKEFYNVWAIIRHLTLVEMDSNERISLRIGVALIGENQPASFLLNPATQYDIKPILREKHLWDYRELPRNTGRFVHSFEERRDIVTKVTFETISETGQIIKSIEAETQNISESGMSLITNLTSDCTKFILIKPLDESPKLLAKVKGIHVLGDNSMRIHLEFISGKWLF